MYLATSVYSGALSTMEQYLPMEQYLQWTSIHSGAVSTMELACRICRLGGLAATLLHATCLLKQILAHSPPLTAYSFLLYSPTNTFVICAKKHL